MNIYESCMRQNKGSMPTSWRLLCVLSLFHGATCSSYSRPRAPTDTRSSASALAANTAELPLGSDSAADTLLLDIQQADPRIRVDLRYASADNFTGEPLPGYTGHHAYLRREAALALGRVEARADREGLRLHVFDAYRPVRATLAMVAWAERVGRTDLLRDGYIASRSRHNLGLAVDLTLEDRLTGAPLDMGTSFDTFSTAAHTANATGEVRANRARLDRLMRAEGFVNYDQEWWHYIFPLPDLLRFDRVIR